MTFGRMQVRPGIAVVDTAGAAVGRVTAAHDEDFLVRRPTGDDVLLPYSAIRALLGDQVVVAIRADEISTPGST